MPETRDQFSYERTDIAVPRQMAAGAAIARRSARMRHAHAALPPHADSDVARIGRGESRARCTVGRGLVRANARDDARRLRTSSGLQGDQAPAHGRVARCRVRDVSGAHAPKRPRCATAPARCARAVRRLGPSTGRKSASARACSAEQCRWLRALRLLCAPAVCRRSRACARTGRAGGIASVRPQFSALTTLEHIGSRPYILMPPHGHREV